MTDVRPVWLTREQRDAMQGASKRWPLLWDAVDAWDAAPADATEAVARIAELEAQVRALQDERADLNELLKAANRRREWNEAQGNPRYVRDALGMPDPQPETT